MARRLARSNARRSTAAQRDARPAARRAAAILALAGVALALPACGRGAKKQSTAEPAAINTGLAALAAENGAHPAAKPVAPQTTAQPAKNPADWTQDKSLDLQAVMRQLEARKAAEQQAQQQVQQPAPQEQTQAAAPASDPTAPSAAPTDPAASGTPPTTTDATASTDAAVPADASTPAPAAPDAAVVITNPDPPPPEPLDVQIAKTTVSLVDLLRRQSVEGPVPFQSYLALALLEAIHPGAVMQIVNAQTTSGTPLSPEEQRIIESLRAFGQGAHQLATLTSPAEMFRQLADMTASIERVLQMRIAGSALATRVLSFGRFTPVANNTFIHGRTIRFLVYCEIEHFAFREIAEHDALALSQQPGSAVDPGDRYAVELGQELQLYTDSGQLVWSLPEQVVVETSRNIRRDFFLTNDVTLPNTLGIGGYTLKIIMRDKISGVQDEANIPLQLVADGVMAGVGQ